MQNKSFLMISTPWLSSASFAFLGGISIPSFTVQQIPLYLNLFFSFLGFVRHEGLSDPYAIMGIVHLSQEDFEEVDRKGKTKKVQDLTTQLKETSVQSATLNPIWEEEYEL